MKKWISRWNEFWFPETTTLGLAACRILAVSAQLLLFLPDLEYQSKLLEVHDRFRDPQLFILAISALVPREVLFTETTLTLLFWSTVAVGIASLIGLFTRASLFAFALGNWIFVAHQYSYSEVHHNEAIFCIFLLLLAFSPSGDSLSVDATLRRRRTPGATAADALTRRVDTALWPLRLVHAVLALTYFSTGLTKLLYGGFQWMNGYTLQYYIFSRALERGLPIGIWLSGHHTLCVLLSVFTIVFELFFFVSLFVPRTARPFLIAGVCFHTGLYVARGGIFLGNVILLVLLLLFVDFGRSRAWGNRALERMIRSRQGCAGAQSRGSRKDR